MDEASARSASCRSITPWGCARCSRCRSWAAASCACRGSTSIARSRRSSAGDESFEGYWRRPEADAKALRQGWYFTGDTGYFDADGDLFVTGRVDDMIITGGENVSPVEVESCLSRHPAVLEVAVVGLADERWGKVVVAFIKRSGDVSPEELDQFCRSSGLATFKRPRPYVFVRTIPKSPVGKLLRRKLVAGEYEFEDGLPGSAHQHGTAA